MTMKRTLCKRLKSILSAVALCEAGILLAEDLELTEDRVVEVPEGETVSYDALTGGAFTLTKTGGGVLSFSALANSQASIVIESGTLKVEGLPTAPDVLSSALLYLDAGQLATLGFVAQGGAPSAGDAGDVESWSDVNGRDLVALRRDGLSIYPKFRAGHETVSGLPLVDFRALGFGQVQQGSCASLELFKKSAKEGATIVGVRDLMIVGMDTEDVKTTIEDYGLSPDHYTTRAAPFVGARHGQTVYFLRGNRNVSGTNSAVANGINENTKRVADGEIRFDGVVQSAAVGYPDGLHLLEYRPTDAVEFSLLAGDRTICTGGARLGAVVAFNIVLPDADRRRVRNYLMTRWIPAPIRSLTLKDGVRLEFSHAAGLHPAVLTYSGQSTVCGGVLLCDEEADATGSIRVEGGRWRYGIGASGMLPSCSQEGGNVTYDSGWYEKPGFRPSVPAFFHVDACDIVGMTTEMLNGTNFVSLWKDADGGGNYATTINNGALRKPFLRQEFLNGRPVVDFGAYCILGGGKAGGAPTVGGWGGAMTWKQDCTDVREVVTVVSDTEDLVDNWANIRNTVTAFDTQYKRAQPFVSNALGGWNFLRGNRDESGVDSAPMLLPTAPAYSTAAITVDGAEVSNGSNFPAGFHVVNIRSGQPNLAANGFSTDRMQTGGGMRIAEYYVFTQELTDGERSNLLDKMSVKWLGKVPTKDILSYGELSIGSAATYRAKYSKVAVSGAFDLDGTMDVAYLALSGTVDVAPAARLSGAVELEDGSCMNIRISGADMAEPAHAFDRLVLSGGTVTLSLDAQSSSGYGGKSIPLIAARSVDGSASFAVGGTKFANKPVSFAWRNGTLYADFAKTGTILVIR